MALSVLSYMSWLSRHATTRDTPTHYSLNLFRVKTTSPKSILTLTKDTLNHGLWNPAKAVQEEKGGELDRFHKRFGSSTSSSTTTVKDASSSSSSSSIKEMLDIAVGVAPKINEKKVVAKKVEAAAPAKGKSAKAAAAKGAPAAKK